MAAEITIPISTFDLTISYVKPEIRLMADRVAPLQALLDALAEWHPELDDIEIIATGKLTEQGVRIRVASEKASFFFGVAACKFVKDAANWSEADEAMRLLELALASLAQTSGLEFGKRLSILSLHLQLKTVPFKDILRKFTSPELLKLDPLPADAMATVIRWPKHRITLDGSAAIANGIFVQMEREFDSTVSLEDIKNTIIEDDDLTQIRKFYGFPADGSVANFLSNHRDISVVLLSAVPKLKQYFEANSILNLEVSADDDGSQTLYAVVVWRGAVPAAAQALDDFSEHWWLDHMTARTSDLAFTYEIF